MSVSAKEKIESEIIAHSPGVRRTSHATPRCGTGRLACPHRAPVQDCRRSGVRDARASVGAQLLCAPHPPLSYQRREGLAGFLFQPVGEIVRREKCGCCRIGQRHLFGQVGADVVRHTLERVTPAGVLRLARCEAQNLTFVLAAHQCDQLQQQAANQFERAEARRRVLRAQTLCQLLDLAKFALVEFKVDVFLQQKRRQLGRICNRHVLQVERINVEARPQESLRDVDDDIALTRRMRDEMDPVRQDKTDAATPELPYAAAHRLLCRAS